MSEAVDTRVVEAKFDSAQFEKGVDKTVKKLDELKKSLNLEDSGKSVAELASKTQTATEQMSGSLEKLENRLTSFVGMLKQKLLSGIADEIVGVFFKIKNSVEGLVRSLSSDQINVGMSKYEQMLTSVRTMVAAGDNENAAYKAIETLGLYADQTSYSLDQMTSALSKMRAAGVSLETGTKAVEGIANACAIAGVNATDAQRAFYNLSQAYSSGTLKYTDYRSLELLNMTTENFKERMLEAAVAAGTLEKKADGTFRTINKNDKKVTGGKQVTVKNLTDALRYNFMNTEAMNKLFGEQFFFDEEEWKKIKAEFSELGKSEEEALAEAKKRFGDVAVNAYFAAREARSFTDVMNTFKDVISRGWSKSFELIIGKLTDATKLFTAITESNFAQAIYNIIDFRNAVLTHWNESGGRDSLVHALEQIDATIGKVLGNFTLFSDTEGQKFEDATRTMGYKLKQLTDRFDTFTQKVDAWFTEDRMRKIKDIINSLRNLFAVTFKNSFEVFVQVLTSGLRAFEIGFDFLYELFDKSEPVMKAFGAAFEKILTPILNVLQPKIDGKDNEAYVALQDALNNILIAAQPLINVLPGIIDLLAKIGAFFVDVAVGTVVANLQFIADILGLIIEIFGKRASSQEARGAGILEYFKQVVTDFGNACSDALTAVTAFFKAVIEDVRKILGLNAEVKGESEEGGFFDHIANFFKTDNFITSVKNWLKAIPGKIKALFKKDGFDQEIYNQILKGEGRVEAEKYKNSFKGPLAKIWESMSAAFKSWIATIKEKMKKVWENVLDTILGKKTGAYKEIKNEKTGKTTYITERVKEGFSLWLDNTVQSISNWIRTIPSTIANLWNKILDFFFGEEVDVETVDDAGNAVTVKQRVKDGFSLWLFNLKNDVVTWLKTEFPEKIKSVWNTIVKGIFGNWEVEELENKDTGKTEKVYTCVQKGLVQWIGDIPSKVSEWFNGNGEEGSGFKAGVLSIWNTVMGFIFGTDAEANEVSKETAEGSENPTEKVKGGFKIWLEDLVKKVPEWISEFKETISTLWDSFLSGIFRANTEASEGSADVSEAINTEETEENLDEKEKDLVATATKFAEELGHSIAKVFNRIPIIITENVDFGVGLFQSLLEKVNAFIENLNLAENAEDVSNSVNKFMEAVQNGDTSELSPFAAKIIEIGQKIKEIVTTTIPGFLTNAWTFISTQSTFFWESILSIFDSPDGSDPFTAIREKVSNIGETISTEIKKIPEYITTAVESVKEIFTKRRGFSTKTLDTINDALVNPSGGIIDINSYRYAMNQASGTIEKEAETWSIWDTISEIGLSIKDAFINLGPMILEGLQTAVKWIGEKITGITNFFKEKPDDVGLIEYIDQMLSGDEDQEKVTLWDSVKGLGQTIKTVLIEVIPNFISEAFKEIAAGIPRLLGQLFGNGEEQTKDAIVDNVEEAMKEAGLEIDKNVESSGSNGFGGFGAILEKGAGALINFFSSSAKADEMQTAAKNTEAGLGVVSKITDKLLSIADVVSDQEVLKFVLVCGSITTALWALKSIVDNVAFIDDVGFTLKWGAIGAIVLALVGLLGYLIYLSETGNEKQLANVEAVFDKLMGVFGQLEAFFLALKGLEFATSVSNTVATVNSADHAVKEAGGIFKLGGKGLLKGAGAVAAGVAIFGFSSDVLGEALDNWSANLTEIFEQIKVGMDDLLGSVHDLVSIADDIQKAREAIVDIGGLFQAMREIFVVQEQVEEQAANLSAEMEGNNSEYISDVFKIGDKFYQLVGDSVYEVSPEDASGKLRKTTYVTKSVLGEFLEITRLFSRLAAAISVFKESVIMPENTKTIMNDFKAVLDLKDQMIEFGKFGATEDFSNFKIAIATLGSAFGLFSFDEPVDEFTVENAISVLNQVFGDGKLQELVTALDEQTSLPSKTKILEDVERMTIFAGGLASIAKSCSDLETGSGEKINDLFEEISKINIYDDNKYSDLLLQFSELGNAIGSFAFNVNDLNETTISNAGQAMDMLLRLAIGLKEIPNNSVLAKAFAGDKSLENFGTGVEILGQNLSNFFKSIENINTKGVSVDYNRHNLELALMAVDSLIQSARRIGDVLVVADWVKDSDEWLNAPLKNLQGTGTAIMTFIDEINSYKMTDNKTVDFEFIYSTFDAIEKLVDIIVKMPAMITQTDDKIKNLGSILFGENTKDPNNNGVMGYLSNFYEKILEVTKRENADFDVQSMSTIVSSYADMAHQIIQLIEVIFDNAETPTISGLYEYHNPMDVLLPVFSSVNNNYDVFDTFLNNAEKFNQKGIDKAKQFFSSLYFLANGLNEFSLKDADGNYNVVEGLSTLLGLNWNGLESVKDNLMDVISLKDILGVDDDLTSPVITPVLEISDDFVAKASLMRSMLGFDTIVQPNPGEYTFNNTSSKLAGDIVVPEQLNNIDINVSSILTSVNDCKTEIRNFNDSLSNVKFVMYGQDFAYAVGPDIDEWLGRQGVYVARNEGRN